MADLFDDKAADWDDGGMKRQLSEAIGSAIVDSIALDEGMSVMDFGAGTGLICAHIAPLVKAVDAVDISPAMLAKLAAKSELQDKVITVCQDILSQPLAKTFDVIVSAMAMHHVQDTSAMLETFAQHLKADGQIALADLDKEDGSFHPEGMEGVFHHGFGRKALAEQLQLHGFIDIHFQTAMTITKDDQSFPVFLLTARKGRA